MCLLLFLGLVADPRLIRIRKEQLDTHYLCEYTQARCIYNYVYTVRTGFLFCVCVRMCMYRYIQWQTERETHIDIHNTNYISRNKKESRGPSASRTMRKHTLFTKLPVFAMRSTMSATLVPCCRTAPTHVLVKSTIFSFIDGDDSIRKKTLELCVDNGDAWKRPEVDKTPFWQLPSSLRNVMSVTTLDTLSMIIFKIIFPRICSI